MRRYKKTVWGILLVLAVLFTAFTSAVPVYADSQSDSIRDVVIVLDPGHGGAASGAIKRWGGKTYKEKTLNLAIAKACKKKLESYAGVKVYLTRTSDRYVSLTGRVSYAKSKKADIFVSLHNNASLKSKDNGACVIYPNNSYKKNIGNNGKNAALCIQKQLVGLGLKNNGIYYRNTEVGSRYPDRSRADYYKVIKQSKLSGIPGIIVEHAYVSNSGDCKKYLSTEEQLAKLGEADALGLAKYFGLTENVIPELTRAEEDGQGGIRLEWKPLEHMDGYIVYRRIAGEEKFCSIADVAGAESISYTDNEAVEGITYEYCICAYHKGKVAVGATSMSDFLTAQVQLKEKPDGVEQKEPSEQTKNL